MDRKSRQAGFSLALLLAGLGSNEACAAGRERLDEAWWTGPLLAANAGTLPPGHFLFEPYFFDIIPTASIDRHGGHHPVPDENNYGSFSYLIYGVTDRFNLSLIPRFGFQQIAGGKNSSNLQLGDWSFQAQYQLTQFEEGHLLPTISLNIGETFPTGKFDRLDPASDGFGTGAYATTFSLYSQSYFWMPTGRILRTRLNFTYALSNRVPIRDMSVYGTANGFLGEAHPGPSFYGDLGLEYSITRNWVAAMDLWLEQDDPTHVAGFQANAPLAFSSGMGRELLLAPALEYNWSPAFGIIMGARIVAWGRNETQSVAPVLAISYVQ
jgi:hypothetical protein